MGRLARTLGGCVGVALAAWLAGARPGLAADADGRWAFATPPKPAIPAAADPALARNPIDHFLQARLAKAGLAPSPEADRRTLARRLYFDLWGLPPEPGEVERFASDPDPGALAKLADQLLNSPHYGERWARHWLDAVHFGESHGYDKDKPRPNAWPYRDYVIRALNADKPYSQFVREQLAGDILHPDDPWATVATGFIAAGPWDFVGHVELPESKTDGLIARYNDRDDMVMATFSTFQSLTVHCARCHDHKFDPIAQKEYYALQAVFAGVDRADRPVDLDPAIHQRRAALRGELASWKAEMEAVRKRVESLAPPEARELGHLAAFVGERLNSLPKEGPASPSNGYHSAIEASPDVVKWAQLDLGETRELESIRLIPARPTDFPETPGFGFPARFKVEVSESPDFANPVVVRDETAADFPNPGDSPVVIDAAGRKARVVRVTATRLWKRSGDWIFALAELQLPSKAARLEAGAAVAALDSIESGRWAKSHLVDGYDSRKALAGAPTDEATRRRALLEAERATLESRRDALVEAALPAELKERRAQAAGELARAEAALAALPKPAMVYAAASDFSPMGSFHPARVPRPVHLLARGEVTAKKELMEPAALAAVGAGGGALEVDPAGGEGARRAALAQWLTRADNLLLRRSIVNRVWHYHFGRGIVETPNDFGRMGSLPTHPELLDWLAHWFVENGESLKALHRLIVTSHAYRQISNGHPEGDRIDGDNRLLWRMSRTRLDAESIRDGILVVSGGLDPRMGGPSDQQFFFKDDHSPVYDYARFDFEGPGASRRAIYRFLVRSVTDPFMDSLDCADPSMLVPRRTATLTALQALATLNDPFVLTQAARFATLAAEGRPALADQIQFAFRRALARQPAPEELDRLAGYARRHGMENLCRLLFNSNEFMFVD